MSTSEKTDDDYVLGTHDDEIQRLGLQHRVWQPTVLDCWRRAGITTGKRVIDVGAGPGWATLDLAEIVGPEGHILAVERSQRFVKAAARSCTLRRLPHVTFQTADVMVEPLQATGYDFAWCRWVASFVSSPATLLQRIRGSLKPSGTAIFHEYSNYATWQVAPPKPAVEDFVREVMASWRAQGGEPDVAVRFPHLLGEAGFRVLDVRPHVFTVSPRNFTWQWPASFIEINLERLKALGRVTEEWAESVRVEFRTAQEDPTAWMTTPMLLEIVAQVE